MTEEENQLLSEHARAIAKILYKNAPIEELTSLGKIEELVRSQMQKHVMPEVGVFLSKMSQGKTQDTNEKSKVSSGNCQLRVLKHKSWNLDPIVN